MVGILKTNIFLIEKDQNLPFVNVPDLIQLGAKSPEIVPLKLAPGEAKTKVALINFSSGTSGLPKGVLISHYNVITNVCQLYNSERTIDFHGAVCNGCLPFFHSTDFFYTS